MADITGTIGNDAIQPFGNSLQLTLSASQAEGIWPVMNVLINGVVALSNVTITANHALGATQTVSVPIPAGTSVSSISLQYVNDDQVSYAQDRNLYVSSINLNGHVLSPSSATYVRWIGGHVYDTIAGQADMLWGGELQFSGSVVTSAAPSAGGTLSVDGLGGIDTVLLGGTHADYSVSKTSGGYTVSKLGGGETLTLSNVERIDFQGVNLALDMDGHAGTTAKIISALFGQSYLGVEEYVGIGISLLDQGMTPTQLAALAVSTPLFQQLAGSSSNTDFVRLVYENVVGSAPSGAELDYYVGLLNSGSFTQASLGLLAAETVANQAHLVGVMQTGIEYI